MGWCEFCQTTHSSSSCYHPGRIQLQAKQVEIEQLRTKVMDTNENTLEWQIEVDTLKAQVEKLRRQRANWRGLVIDLVNQFALETDKGLFTSGLRDLEDAFSALELEEGCSRQDLWNKRKE